MKRLAMLVAATGLLAGGAVAVAADKPVAPLRGAVHVSVATTLANGSEHSVAVDRGKVTALGNGSITLDEKGAGSVTITLAADAKVPPRLQVGRRALVVSRDGKGARIVPAGLGAQGPVIGAAAVGWWGLETSAGESA